MGEECTCAVYSTLRNRRYGMNMNYWLRYWTTLFCKAHAKESNIVIGMLWEPEDADSKQASWKMSIHSCSYGVDEGLVEMELKRRSKSGSKRSSAIERRLDGMCHNTQERDLRRDRSQEPNAPNRGCRLVSSHLCISHLKQSPVMFFRSLHAATKWFGDKHRKHERFKNLQLLWS